MLIPNIHRHNRNLFLSIQGFTAIPTRLQHLPRLRVPERCKLHCVFHQHLHAEPEPGPRGYGSGSDGVREDRERRYESGLPVSALI